MKVNQRESCKDLQDQKKEMVRFPNRLTTCLNINDTSSGFSQIESEVRSVLDQAVSNGGVDSYTVNVPQVLAIPEMVRAQRVLDHISFEARLAGGVSRVLVKGIVHN